MDGEIGAAVSIEQIHLEDNESTDSVPDMDGEIEQNNLKKTDSTIDIPTIVSLFWTASITDEENLEAEIPIPNSLEETKSWSHFDEIHPVQCNFNFALITQIRNFLIKHNGKTMIENFVACFSNQLNDQFKQEWSWPEFRYTLRFITSIQIDDDGQKYIVLTKQTPFQKWCLKESFASRRQTATVRKLDSVRSIDRNLREKPSGDDSDASVNLRSKSTSNVNFRSTEETQNADGEKQAGLLRRSQSTCSSIATQNSNWDDGALSSTSTIPISEHCIYEWQRSHLHLEQSKNSIQSSSTSSVPSTSKMKNEIEHEIKNGVISNELSDLSVETAASCSKESSIPSIEESLRAKGFSIPSMTSYLSAQVGSFGNLVAPSPSKTRPSSGRAPWKTSCESVVSSSFFWTSDGEEEGDDDDDDVIDEKSFSCVLPAEKEWMLACSGGCLFKLKRMTLESPELLTSKDFVQGFTVLHWAAKLGRLDIVEFVMVSCSGDDGEGGEDGPSRRLLLDAKSRTGATPLHVAATFGKDGVIVRLIKMGANIHLHDYAGKKPKDLVKESVDQNVQWMLGKMVVRTNSDGGTFTVADTVHKDRVGRLRRNDALTTSKRRSSFRGMTKSISFLHKRSLMNNFSRNKDISDPKLIE